MGFQDYSILGENMETKVNVSNVSICNKTLKEIWDATTPGKKCIAQNIYGAIFEMKGIADNGELKAYGVMHNSSPKDPGAPALWDDQKNIWKKIVPKRNFYGAITFDVDSNCIYPPTTFYPSKELAKANTKFDIIAWDIKTMNIEK